MKDLLDKLSSYYLFNCLIPGAMFLYILSLIIGRALLSNENLLIEAVYCYSVGLVINRVGALVVGPLVRYIMGIKFIEYEKYLFAVLKDNKIDLLNEVCNMYRSISSMFLILVLFITLRKISGTNMPDNCLLFILFSAILAIFVMSYIKQIKLITKRVEAVYEREHK